MKSPHLLHSSKEPEHADPVPASAKPVLLIPTYEPDECMLGLIDQLIVQLVAPSIAQAIVVIDDGSSPDRAEVFRKLEERKCVQVLRHAVNLGKGAALKTGFNHVLVHFPKALGVITVDADGQHLPCDVAKIAVALTRSARDIWMGSRTFTRNIPFRSRFGNRLTRMVFQMVTGVSLRDTQSGLRGIPAFFLKDLLLIRSTRYDFETDLLVRAVQDKIPLREIPIETIYIRENASSHFNPLLDSLKIYFVFVRFTFSSVATALIDLLIFSATHWSTGKILLSSLSGRTVAGCFNFTIGKRIVFRSKGNWIPEAMRYFLLVFLLMLVSNSMIGSLMRFFGMGVYPAKIIAETVLFLVSFTVQRLLIFTSGGAETLSPEENIAPTDWDAYYERPFRAASITRRLTARRLIRTLAIYSDPKVQMSIMEIGGGNSCFFSAISKSLSPSRYLIVDNNRKGLEQFRKNNPNATSVELIEKDLLTLGPSSGPVDVCFSVGVIEHFSVEDTQRAIHAHFRVVKPGGIVLITFPTPTLIYRATRFVAERLDLWAFPDERPRPIGEIVREVQRYGKIEHTSIIWSIVLTQGIVVARALGGSELHSTRQN